MRKLYDKYFEIPEQGEGVISETKFFARLILSVICIVLCLCAMGYNAYAYFNSTIESTSNMLQASTYSLEIDVKCVQEGQGSFVEDKVVTGRYVLQPGAYTFTLKKSETSTASTGYCRIDIGVKEANGETQYEKRYYTQQIGAVEGKDKPVTERKVVISVDQETVIQLETCWGTFAGSEDILADDKVIVYQEGKVSLSNTVPIPEPEKLEEETTLEGQEEVEDQGGEQLENPPVTNDSGEKESEETQELEVSL